MKKIILICAGGMSTSLLVNKMCEVATEKGYEADINAYGLMSYKKVIDDADVVLMGPQVRYYMETLRQAYPHLKIDSIDMKDYGTMNGSKVLEHAITLIDQTKEF